MFGENDVGQTRGAWWLGKRKCIPETPKIGKFIFRIVTSTPDESFTLPLGSPAFTHDFEVEWGDTESNTITSYDDVGKTHVFATAGTYDITMTGTCQYFGFVYGETHRNKITAIISLSADMGFKYLGFGWCVNLTSIDNTFSRISSLVSGAQMFSGCAGLTSIPPELFSNCYAIASFEECFMECTALASVTGDIFDNCENVLSMEGCFASCYSLTTIPTGLFSDLTNVTNFSSVFTITPITELPSDLFTNCISATNFAQAFVGCGLLTTIPSDVFVNNIAAESFYSTFGECHTLPTIPANLFDSCVNVKRMDLVFYHCAALTAIPSGLFDGCVLTEDFQLAFADCTGINTDLPTNLILHNTVVENYHGMFTGCASMTGDGTAFVDTAEANATASGISLTHDGCFTGCTSLPDYSLIPSDWK